MRPPFSLIVAFATLAGLAAESRAQTAGGLDHSFGSGGTVVMSVPGYSVEGRAVALAADGKIILAGTATNGATMPVHRFVVARLNTDGSPDHSFANGGIKVYVPRQVGSASECFGRGVLVLSDGSILIGGHSGNQFIVSKLAPDGTEDSAFDGVCSVLGSTGGTGVTVEVNAMTLDRRFNPNRLMVAGSATAYGEKDATTQVVTEVSDAAKHPWLQGFDLSGVALPNPVIDTVNVGSPVPAVNEITACVSSRDGTAIMAGLSRGHRWVVLAGRTDKLDPPLLGTGFFNKVHAIGTSSGSAGFRVAYGGADNNLPGIRVGRADTLTGRNFFGPMLPGQQTEASSPTPAGHTCLGIHDRPDGRIVVATRDLGGQVSVFRLTSRGMMDTTSGAGGRFVIATSELEFTPWAVVAQPDDQLIVAGNAMATNLCVVRVNLGPQVQAAPPAMPRILVSGTTSPYLVRVPDGLPATLTVAVDCPDPVRFEWSWTGDSVVTVTDGNLSRWQIDRVLYEQHGSPNVRVTGEAGNVSEFWTFDVILAIRNYTISPQIWPKGWSTFYPITDVRLVGYDGRMIRQCDVSWGGAPQPSSDPGYYSANGIIVIPYGVTADGYRDVRVSIRKAPTDPYAIAPRAKLLASGTSGDVSLDSITSSTGTYSSTWQKNGKTHRDAAGNPTAPVFTSATFADAGSYRAIIRNSRGSFTSPAIQVGVVDTTNPREAFGMIGKAVAMPAPSAGSGMTYQWQFNGVGLVDSKRIAGAKSQTLTIRSVEAGDVGAYTCRVSNSDGSLLSAPTNLSLMAGVPSFEALVLPDASMLESYAFDLRPHATVGANKFSVSGLPRGLTADATSGVISGTPLVAGDFMVRVIASNPAGSGPPLLLPLHVEQLPTGSSGRHTMVQGETDRFRLDLKIAESGAYSALVQIYQGKPVRKAFKGTVRRTGTNLAIDFTIEQPTDYIPPELVFALRFSGGTWTLNSTLPVYRHVWNSRSNPAAAYQGYCTANFGGNDIDGYAGITVSSSGAVTIKCRMIDGLPYIGSTVISQGGAIPMLMWKPGGRGLLVGTPQITPGPALGTYTASVTGQLEWRYEKGTTYQLGDEWGGGALLDVKGSRYLPPNVPLISSSLMFDLPEQLLNIRASWVDPATSGWDSRLGTMSRSHRIAWGPMGDGYDMARFGGISFSPKTGLFSGRVTLRVPSLVSFGGTGYSVPVTFTGMAVRTDPFSPEAAGQGFYFRRLREFYDSYGRLVLQTQRAFGRVYLEGVQ